jgi:hypothetical protein
MFFLKDLMWLQKKASVGFHSALSGILLLPVIPLRRDDSYLQAWVLTQYSSILVTTVSGGLFDFV